MKKEKFSCGNVSKWCDQNCLERLRNRGEAIGEFVAAMQLRFFSPINLLRRYTCPEAFVFTMDGDEVFCQPAHFGGRGVILLSANVAASSIHPTSSHSSNSPSRCPTKHPVRHLSLTSKYPFTPLQGRTERPRTMATQKVESEAPLEQQLQRAQDVPSSTEATATSTFECQPKLLLVRPPRPFRFCEECNLNRYFEDSDYEREAELARTRPWGTRPPSETSWARLSEATDLLSTIFRFLQLRELMAM